jgi:hypothetical protein
VDGGTLEHRDDPALGASLEETEPDVLDFEEESDLEDLYMNVAEGGERFDDDRAWPGLSERLLGNNSLLCRYERRDGIRYQGSSTLHHGATQNLGPS